MKRVTGALGFQRSIAERVSGGTGVSSNRPAYRRA
jgi:hypothetical protein